MADIGSPLVFFKLCWWFLTYFERIQHCYCVLEIYVLYFFLEAGNTPLLLQMYKKNNGVLCVSQQPEIEHPTQGSPPCYTAVMG